MKKLIIPVLTILAVVGCSEPKDEATDVAQQACIADKNSDVNSMADFMSNEMFEQNKVMHESADPQLKSILKMLNCDVKSTEVLEKGGFVVNFKKHNSYELAEIDGDYKVVGEQYF